MAVETLEVQMADLRNSVAALRQQVSDSRNASDRVVIMVDRSNLDQTWRRIETGANRPDYLKLTEVLTGSRTLKQVRIYYSDVDYEVVPEIDRVDWQRRQDFYTFLRHQGWVLRGVKKRMYDGIPVEKGLDGCLIRDMEMICRDGRCDTIVLIAGDADYCDVVSDVQERYCVRVEVAFFPNQTARDLQVKASKFVNLECLKDRIVRQPTKI